MTGNIIKSRLKYESKNKEYKITIMPLNQVLESEEQFERKNETEKSQEDVLLLIDKLEKGFKKVNKKAKEIAENDGRTIVTYDDAEQAIELIRVENARKRIEEHVILELEENFEICPLCGMPIPEEEFERYGTCCLCDLEGEQTF